MMKMLSFVALMNDEMRVKPRQNDFDRLLISCAVVIVVDCEDKQECDYHNIRNQSLEVRVDSVQ